MEEQIRISFFKHQVNALDDEKLFKLFRKEGMAGYGVWWRLLEMLGGVKEHRLQRDYEYIAFKMYHPDLAELIQRVVEDYGLFKTNKDYFWNSSFTAQMEDLNTRYQKRAAAGSKGGKRKSELKQSQSNAVVMLPENDSNAIIDKIREEESRKEENIRDDISISPNEEKETSSSSSSDDDATTRFFDNRISDSKFLRIVRNYMYKGARMPTEEATHLIDLFAPNWVTKDGTRSFAGHEEDACQFWSVPRERKYIDGPRLSAAACRGVDIWLNMIEKARIYDTNVLNEFRGCGYDKEKNELWLQLSHLKWAKYIEEHYVQQLAPVFQSMYPKTKFEYRTK